MIVWGLLAVLFFLQGLYYVYLIALPSEGSAELLLDKLSGFATFGFPMAALSTGIFLFKTKMRFPDQAARSLALVLGGLGILFLAIGIYAVYFLWPDPQKTIDLMTIVSIFVGFLVYPVVVLLLPWIYMKRGDLRRNSTAQMVPFVICLAAHMLQFVLAVVWPFSEVLRFGGASLALLYSAVNFYNLRTSVE
jgi:hypothetical protein